MPATRILPARLAAFFAFFATLWAVVTVSNAALHVTHGLKAEYFRLSIG